MFDEVSPAVEGREEGKDDVHVGVGVVVGVGGVNGEPAEVRGIV